jgi:hypothetical protein
MLELVMAAIKFRFVTECEVTVTADTHEEAYLRFKDMVHGDLPISQQQGLTVYPPEQSALYFSKDSEEEFHEVPMMKGDFKSDILSH